MELNRLGHIGHAKRCLAGLPASQVETDASGMAVVFYCIGVLDLLDGVPPPSETAEWRAWVWAMWGDGGWRPSSFMNASAAPHLIMTYTALLTLSILRDPFDNLDRPALVRFVGRCQRADGSFSTLPESGDTDLRTLYCAFAICTMVDDWSSVDVPAALAFVARCRTHEHGYGQQPNAEAHGGLTYVAIASIHLAHHTLPPAERTATTAWLLSLQSTGFSGRTGKSPDACYGFWCSAALAILCGHNRIYPPDPLRAFIRACEFRYGGIGKAPGDSPDPYHTYLALAAWLLAGDDHTRMDPLLNATLPTADWARTMIPDPQRRGDR